jgi:putative beta-barrel porin BBP2
MMMRFRPAWPLTYTPAARFARVVVLAALAVHVHASPAAAGQPPAPPPDDTPEHQQSHLVWRPSFALTNLGWDSNVFNLPEEPAAPGGTTDQRGDFVTSFAAGLAPIWRVGDARIVTDTGLAYNYFQHFEQERGFDATARGSLEVPVSRATLHASGGYANVRQRLNFEIDTRARRTERDYAGGIDLAVGSRSRLELRARRGEVVFDEDSPDAAFLRDTLNRDERTAAVSFEYALTPFTNFVATGERGIHEFPLSPMRNGDSDGVFAGLSLSPDAVISGQGSFGWRKVTVTNPVIPSFSGLNGDIDLATVLGTSTRLAFRAERIVNFSADELSPYYVQTRAGLAVTQALGESWEIAARFDRVRLDYVQSMLEPGAQYREHVDFYGGGVGYRFPGGFRIGLQGELMRRRASNDPSRAYDTLRFYTVISKALQF